MPRAPADTELLQRVSSLIDECGGNQAAAARRLGVSRLDVNRLLKQKGRVTTPKRRRLWTGLEKATGAHIGDLRPVKTIQEIQNVPAIALQVLQFMTEAVGRAAND